MEAPVALCCSLRNAESLRRDECTFVDRFVAFPLVVVIACRSIHPSSAQEALNRCGPEIDRWTTTTGETMDVVERRLIAGSIAPVGSLARLTRLRRPVRLPIRQHWSA